ncbi:hypothetical protein MGN70_005621 [Eutypa lata]|nr:hypothetical protein MGN70_005621 [Eutypa lata]
MHRSTALPNPGYSARQLYSRATPSYGREPEHTTRSPSFTNPLRRHPLSPTPSPSIGYTAPVGRMDSSYGGKSQAANIPPLMTITTNGQLVYGDTPQNSIKIDIQGTIDKGFFLSDGEWTCYRRNYFSCNCSYSLTPYYPNANIQYIPNGSSQTYHVLGFAMCIAAVVAESDSHMIELVQHTPKRDKGPVQRPEKVRLNPKPPQQVTHPLGLYTSPHDMASGSRSLYEGASYGQGGQNSFPTEYTFERIQFKQATANNGKRRAAQQYYHLLVELYADVGNQVSDGFIKIAQRKSAKMIVRGRSPGHYQTDRRGSTGSGPGGSSGMGSYGGSQVLGTDYGSSGSSMLPGSYGVGSGYDPRSGHYGTTRHHELPADPGMSADEAKAVDTAKEYQYYPAAIYEGSNSRHGIPMFSDRAAEHDHMMTSTSTATDSTASSKLKHEFEGTLPSIIYQPGPSYYPGGCSRFEGKPSSAGYYPIPQSG